MRLLYCTTIYTENGSSSSRKKQFPRGLNFPRFYIFFGEENEENPGISSCENNVIEAIGKDYCPHI